MTEPTPKTAPARDRLFALIASIPGSGSVDWCGQARALLDEIVTPRPPADASHGLSVQHADALWDAVAIPGPTAPTFPMQHERVCRAVAEILDEVTPTSADDVECACDPAPHREDDGTYSHWAGCPIADAQQQADEAHRLALSQALDLGTGAPWDAIHERVQELRRLAAEAQQPETDDTGEEAQARPVCEGFRWIGQSFATCDRCGKPAWDHVGEEVPVEDAGPFDTRSTVRPWKPGEADRIRAKWSPGTEQSTP